jgi:hypothetical protein
VPHSHAKACFAVAITVVEEEAPRISGDNSWVAGHPEGGVSQRIEARIDTLVHDLEKSD